MKFNKDLFFASASISALAISIFAVIKAIKTATKADEKIDEVNDILEKNREQLNKIAGTVDKTVTELADDMSVTIPNEIVSKAMSRAANDAARNAAASVISEAKSEIKTTVREAQDSLYSELKETLTAEHMKQWKKKAGQVDVLALKRKFTEEGKNEVKKILTSDLETMKVEAQEKVNSLVAAVTNEINARTEFVRAVREGIKV